MTHRSAASSDNCPDGACARPDAYGCTFGDHIVDIPGNQVPKNCTLHNKQVAADIAATHPDLLVITNFDVTSDVKASMQAEIQQLGSAVKRVVLLPAPPTGKNPASCYLADGPPTTCVSTIGPQASISNQLSLAATVGAVVVDPTSWFCSDGFCPAFAGGIPTRYDAVHMVAEYGEHIAPVVLEAFRAEHLV